MTPLEPSDDDPRFPDLRRRAASGFALALISLFAIWAGGAWTAMLAGTGAIIMLWEWRDIACGAADPPSMIGPGLMAALGCAVAAGWGLTAAAAAILASSAVVAALDRREGRDTLWGWLGGVYIGLGAAAVIAIRAHPDDGLRMALWLLVSVACADIGGYFAGRAIGGPKLWRRVSPSKTWAGLVGGVALAAVVGAGFGFWAPDIDTARLLAVSALAALLALLGDLLESGVKRRFGVKDSGRLMPGHGGVLDRLDGLLLAAIVIGALVSGRDASVFSW